MPATHIANKSQMEEAVKATNNPFYFISRIKIVHIRRDLVDFMMFDYQKRIVYDLIRNEYVITLKPRQMGITTLLCAYALWLITFRPNQKVIIISIKQTTAKAFLRKMHRMWDFRPQHLKGRPIDRTREESFGTSTHVILSNGSEIETLPAT